MIKRIAILFFLLIAAGVGAYYYLLHISVPPEPNLTGELKSAELSIDNIARQFDFYVPARITGANQSKPDIPLIFVLHGSMSSGADIRKMTAYEFDLLADREGIIVVYPTGYDNHWNDCRGSASYTANTKNINDPVFFKNMIDYFSERYGIDRTRVYATGHSNGGHMVYRLGLELPELFAALAPISANMPVAENRDCGEKKLPISIAIINGTEDSVNPYEGGLVEVFGDTSRGTVMSSVQSAAYWHELAAMDKTPVLQQLAEVDGDITTRISLASWRGHGGYEVRLYTLHGSGHVIPSKKTDFGRLLGNPAGDMEAAIEIWQFFKSVGTAEDSAQAGPAINNTVCQQPRPEMCTRDYRPVCAAIVDGANKTYSNACTACSDPAVISYIPGACAGTGSADGKLRVP